MNKFINNMLNDLWMSVFIIKNSAGYFAGLLHSKERPQIVLQTNFNRISGFTIGTSFQSVQNKVSRA